MFGIKKLQESIDILKKAIDEINITMSLVHSQTKALYKNNESESLRRTKDLIDLSLNVTAIKIKIHDIDQRIQPYQKNQDKLIELEKMIHDCVDLQIRRIQQNEDMNLSLSQVIDSQRNIMQYLESQDKINEDILAVIETYGPIKKVPKLPKKTLATTDTL